METCPKCKGKFPARDARGGYATLTVFRGGALDTKVRCPECGHVFQAKTIRHLGFLGPRIFRFFLAATILVAVGIVLYLVVLKPMLPMTP